MIAKIKSRVDFSGIVNYANNVREKSARIIGSNGVLLIDNSTITDSFQAQLRIPDANGKLHRLGKPVKHISIAFSPEDAARFPDKEDGDRFMSQLAEEWMHEMGFDPANTQYIIARHFDKRHPHCHLVFNRIANDGSIISDSNERRRNERACRVIKQRHGLTFGNRRSRQINAGRLRKYDAERLLIRRLVLDNLSRSDDWDIFARSLAKDGITISFSTDCKSGRIRGVAYDHNGFRISGSKLGSHGSFTYGSLCKQLGSFESNQSVVSYSGVVKQRNITYVPVVRYIEILASLVSVTSKAKSGKGDNREYEVGPRGRKWERVDDYIEEENICYKLKI